MDYKRAEGTSKEPKTEPTVDKILKQNLLDSSWQNAETGFPTY
jgi:hypothetical protein